jgi:hypothetical protein
VARTWRRWLIVLASTVALCSIPAVIAALPVQGSTIGAAALRARIMASASRPYQGYAESTADFGLPSLPDLGNVSMLLDGTTDQYVWYRSAGYWRADVVSAEGENDTYGDGGVTYLWNYGSNSYIQIIGTEPVRLPRAADLLPPDLARRLLGYASSADHLSRLPPQRVAGVAAAGLRLIPADPATTVGEVDIWVDPVTGLPLEVEVTGRGASHPILVSRFLDLSERRPSRATVTPDPAPGTGFTTTVLPDVSGILNGFGPLLPSRLAGMDRVASPGGLADVAAYGAGFSRFAVLPLPYGVGVRALNAASDAGAGGLSLPNGIGAAMQTPLLTVVLVQGQSGGPVYLLTGTVTAALLVRAATDLLNLAEQQQP